MSHGEILERMQGNLQAEECYESMKEHLVRNGIAASESVMTLGLWLTLDPTSERFHNNAAANGMLTRHYRKPYVVPEHV